MSPITLANFRIPPCTWYCIGPASSSFASFSDIVGKAKVPGIDLSSSSESSVDGSGCVQAGRKESGSQVRSTAISLRDMVPVREMSLKRVGGMGSYLE
jgi:hypothetical protein